MSQRPAQNIMDPCKMLELANEQKMTRLYDKTTDGTDKIQSLVGALANEISNLPEKINMRDTKTVRIVAAQYVDACRTVGTIPNKIGLCRAMGISRQAVDSFMNMNPAHPTTEFLEIVLDSFAEILSNSALVGASNMVMSIFITKAVYKWRDNIAIEYVSKTPLGETEDPEILRQRIMEDVVLDEG